MYNDVPLEVLTVLEGLIEGFDKEVAERAHLKPNDLHDIAWAIWPFAEVDEVWIYGSRARGDFYHWSDVDLAITGLGGKAVAYAIKDRLMEVTSFPRKVDVVSWPEIQNDEFRALVLRDHKVLWRRPTK
jgi:uncharacterized protein